MVCLGNICRSPVAEGILREKLKNYKLDITVDSAGTSNYHVGENPDKRSIANAAKNKLDISQLKARQFEVEDFNRFDLIFAMDENNLKDIISLARNEDDKNKVKLLLAEHSKNGLSAVPDPYFGGENGFQLVFDLLNESCEHLAKKLHQETNSIKQ